MTLPKHKYLLTYRYSEIIHDLTVQFSSRFLAGLDYRRTREQMIQAARSGKQNIVEGVGQGYTSKKGEIKLLGVSRASLEELLADYEDYLRQRNLQIWLKTDYRVTRFREIGFDLSHLRNLSNLGHLIEKPILPDNSEQAANFLLTLCHQITYLLSKQIDSCEKKFVEDGGFSENLFRRRLQVKINKSIK